MGKFQFVKLSPLIVSDNYKIAYTCRAKNFTSKVHLKVSGLISTRAVNLLLAKFLITIRRAYMRRLHSYTCINCKNRTLFITKFVTQVSYVIMAASLRKLAVFAAVCLSS